MRTPFLLLGLTLGIAIAPAAAQSAPCGPLPISSLRNHDPWLAHFFTGPWAAQSFNVFFDLHVQVPITLASLRIPTYDQGLGNPTIPSQDGNIAEVRIYLVPGTRTGNELSPAGWGLQQPTSGLPEVRAELTVTPFPGESPIRNFKDATGAPATLQIQPGSYGVCVEVLPTTWNGTALIPGQTNVPLLNPGPLHTLVNWQHPVSSWSDGFVGFDNGGLQAAGWRETDGAGNLVPNPNPTSVGGSFDVNLAIEYVPGDPASTFAVPFGAGCYDAPRAVYERILPDRSPTTDLADTEWTLAFTPDPTGGHYTVTPGGPIFDGPAAVLGGTSLLSSTPTSSSGGGWQNGSFVHPLDPARFPAGLPFPGGTCTAITINTHGRIHLDATYDNSAATNAHSAGDLAPFRDLLPQLLPFHASLDPLTAGEFRLEDPSPGGGVRVTWFGVRSSGYYNVTGFCDVQVELLPNGDVTFAYGPRADNDGVFNTTIVGFGPGGGAPLGEPVDWSAITSHRTGFGGVAPTLSLSAWPVLATTVDARITDLGGSPAQPIGGFLSFGLARLPSGLPLLPYGMPGCESHLDLGQVVFSVLLPNVNNTELTWSWSVPAAANGVSVYLQGGVLGPTPGNAVGLTLTNGLCARVGS